MNRIFDQSNPKSSSSLSLLEKKLKEFLTENLISTYENDTLNNSTSTTGINNIGTSASTNTSSNADGICTMEIDSHYLKDISINSTAIKKIMKIQNTFTIPVSLLINSSSSVKSSSSVLKNEQEEGRTRKTNKGNLKNHHHSSFSKTQITCLTNTKSSSSSSLQSGELVWLGTQDGHLHQILLENITFQDSSKNVYSIHSTCFFTRQNHSFIEHIQTFQRINSGRNTTLTSDKYNHRTQENEHDTFLLIVDNHGSIYFLIDGTLVEEIDLDGVKCVDCTPLLNDSIATLFEHGHRRYHNFPTMLVADEQNTIHAVSHIKNQSLWKRRVFQLSETKSKAISTNLLKMNSSSSHPALTEESKKKFSSHHFSMPSHSVQSGESVKIFGVSNYRVSSNPNKNKPSNGKQRELDYIMGYVVVLSNGQIQFYVEQELIHVVNVPCSIQSFSKYPISCSSSPSHLKEHGRDDNQNNPIRNSSTNAKCFNKDQSLNLTPTTLYLSCIDHRIYKLKNLQLQIYAETTQTMSKMMTIAVPLSSSINLPNNKEEQTNHCSQNEELLVCSGVQSDLFVFYRGQCIGVVTTLSKPVHVWTAFQVNESSSLCLVYGLQENCGIDDDDDDENENDVLKVVVLSI